MNVSWWSIKIKKGGKCGFNLLEVLSFPKATQNKTSLFPKSSTSLKWCMFPGKRHDSYSFWETYLLKATGYDSGIGNMVGFLEAAAFRDVIIYLVFSLCRAESYSLVSSYWLISTTTLLKTQGLLLLSGFQLSAQEPATYSWQNCRSFLQTLFSGCTCLHYKT